MCLHMYMHLKMTTWADGALLKHALSFTVFLKSKGETGRVALLSCCETALNSLFQMKRTLTLSHLPVAAACWGREGGRGCWLFPQPAHGRTSLQAQQRQTSCILPLQPPCLKAKTESDPWKKEEIPPGSWTFSCPKPGHRNICLFSQSFSFESLKITWKLIFRLKQAAGRPPWKPRCEPYIYTRNQTGPKISKFITISASHVPPF